MRKDNFKRNAVEGNGIYYMRARYYDANVGRFISEDPKGFDGGDLNLYSYCLNNPINAMDADGTIVQSLIAGGIAGGIVFGVSFATELAGGTSLQSAAITAGINGATTAVSVGLAASGVGFFASGAAAIATNSALQQLVYGNVSIASAAINALPPSMGGYALSMVRGVGPYVGAAVTGMITGPISLASDVFLPTGPINGAISNSTSLNIAPSSGK